MSDEDMRDMRELAVRAMVGCLAEEHGRAEALRRRVARLEEENAFLRGKLYGKGAEPTEGVSCDE